MSDQPSDPVRFFAKSTNTMSKKRTRERQLAKHAARRHATRRRHRRRRGMAIVVAAVVIVAAGTLAFLTFSGSKKPSAAPTPAGSPGANCDYKVDKAADTGHKNALPPPPEFAIDVNKTYTAVMKTSLGTFDIVLNPKLAPCTVNSFVYLSKKGFYDDVIFHRIDKSLGVIQGGDPAGNGLGGPGYNMPEEVNSSLKYTIGTVAMAKSSSPHTTGSQFFVVTGKGAATLPPQYTVIGKISSGMASVMKIFGQPVVGGSGQDAQQPTHKIVIQKVTIKTQ